MCQNTCFHLLMDVRDFKYESANSDFIRFLPPNFFLLVWPIFTAFSKADATFSPVFALVSKYAKPIWCATLSASETDTKWSDSLLGKIKLEKIVYVPIWPWILHCDKEIFKFLLIIVEKLNSKKGHNKSKINFFISWFSAYHVKLIVFGSVENTHTLLSPPTNDSST